MYYEKIRDFLLIHIPRERDNYASIKRIKELINKRGRKEIKNISLSQLQRIINKLIKNKRIGWVVNNSEHPKKFPIKKYYINLLVN